MKPLKFTLKQKLKLIELCRLYFKGYDLINWSMSVKDCIHLRKEIGQQKVDGSVMVGIYKSEHIPWLEMCLVHLPKLMFAQSITKYGNGHLQHHQIRMMLNDNHPIDYLYAEYKSGNK